MRDTSIQEEMEGMVKGLGAQEHVKTESVRFGEDWGSWEQSFSSGT